MLLAAADWSDFVPVGALVFTIASFWWIYLRRGRLRVAVPGTYASAVTGSTLRVRFPLVIFNSGAAAIVVDSLRLVVEDHELEWISTRSTLRPKPEDFLDFASPFAIRGREAYEVHAEFGDDGKAWHPELGQTYHMRIDWKDSARWKELIDFDWHAPDHDVASYIARRNRPGTADPIDPA